LLPTWPAVRARWSNTPHARASSSFFPSGGVKEWTFFIAAAITMMLGSIPQQDVFQRVMSANSAATARKGPVIGGMLYMLFAFMCPCLSWWPRAAGHAGRNGSDLLKDDPQKGAAHPGDGAHADGCRCFFWRAAVGHHVHGLGHAAGAPT
jgi:hypothetical protein